VRRQFYYCKSRDKLGLVQATTKNIFLIGHYLVVTILEAIHDATITSCRMDNAESID
jgi:hypothetical protein